MSMTKTITALSFARHGAKFWRKYTSYSFAARTQLAPLTAAELLKAVHALPICFCRKGTRFFLAGLLSPVPDDNYFVVPDGKWMGGYVPACFRGHPFSLAQVDGQTALCVDESSGLITDTEGESLFNADEQISDPVAQVLKFLQTVAQNRVATQQGVDALAAAEVLVEWPVKMSVKGKDIQLSGIYRIDEAKLAALPDNMFLGLRKTVALAIAYAQLFSMGNVGILHKLAEVRAKMAKPDGPNIETLMKNDDIFRF